MAAEKADGAAYYSIAGGQESIYDETSVDAIAPDSSERAAVGGAWDGSRRNTDWNHYASAQTRLTNPTARPAFYLKQQALGGQSGGGGGGGSADVMAASSTTRDSKGPSHNCLVVLIVIGLIVAIAAAGMAGFALSRSPGTSSNSESASAGAARQRQM